MSKRKNSKSSRQTGASHHDRAAAMGNRPMVAVVMNLWPGAIVGSIVERAR